MSKSTQKLSHELINIQVAIELDKGKKIAEVAEKFDLKISAVKAVASELLEEKQQKKVVKSHRFSVSEIELLVGRIGAGESIKNICSEAGITEKTLRRWCKQRGVTVPRRLDQISLVEKEEIDGACVSTFVKLIVRLEVEILSFKSVTVARTLSLLAPKL